METITENTIPEEIEALKPYAAYLMWEPDALTKSTQNLTVAQWHQRFPTWSAESMIYGLQKLTALAEKGKVLYDVYSPEEIKEDPAREHVKFWFMPAEYQPSEKPFVLCYAGGGYSTVCSVAESFSTAARLTELGYNVFVPTYRVGLPNLMPKPLDDLNATLAFILNRRDTFRLKDTRYILNGFSAGANLICLWGTEKNGWQKYGKPRPHALFSVYTVSRYFTDDMDENRRAVINVFLETMLGKNYTPEMADRYDVLKNLTGSYPPCYIVHALDDEVVDYRNSADLSARLSEFGIEQKLELAENGNHGFGDGRGCAAYGWIERAAAFSEALP